MSNDSRFWISRGAVLACMLADLLIITKIVDAGFQFGATAWQLYIWFAALLVVTALGLVIAIKYYYRHKALRWENNRREAERLAIETLASVGKRQKRP